MIPTNKTERRTWAKPVKAAEQPTKPLNVLVVDNAIGGTLGANANFINIKDSEGNRFKVTQIDWDATDKQWFRPGAGNGTPTIGPVLAKDSPDVIIFSKPDLIIPRDSSPDTQDPMISAIIASSRLKPPPHIIINEWTAGGLVDQADMTAMEKNLEALRAAGVKFEIVNSPAPSDVFAALEKVAGNRGESAAGAVSAFAL